MVNIGKASVSNKVVKNLESSKIPKSGEPSPKITEGTNTKIKPLYAIRGGKGTQAEPYILDGNTFETDLKYVQKLANETGQDIYYTFVRNGKTVTRHAVPN